MKKILLLTILISSFNLIAQNYYPSIVSIPETGFEQLRNDNSYILRLTQDSGQWVPQTRFIRDVAPNIAYTGASIVSTWKNNTWEDNQAMLDSFVLDNSNRLSIVYNKSTYNYPGYNGQSKAKYVFNYNSTNQLTQLDYFEATPPTSSNYQKSSVTYFKYDTNGKQIQDSNIYYYSGVQISLSQYVYDGDKLTTMVQLSGTDTTAKTYYTYAGNLLTSTTSMAYDAGADEWTLNYSDTFEYNASNKVSRRLTAGYVFRDGNLSFENYRNETYTYTPNHQLQEMIERIWENSAWINYKKTTIAYQANNKPDMGYLYLAEGTDDWSTTPSNKYVFQVSAGINSSPNPLSNVVIFPNPANDMITIDMDKHLANLIIFDITGKQVYEQTSVKGKHQINLSNFKNGMYYTIIQSQTHQQTEKIIVRH